MRITIQTERFLVMNRSGSLYSLCAACGDEVRMITVDQAATLACVNAREIYREVEAGKLHFMETTKGSLLVCLDSLNGSNLKQSNQ